MSANQNKISISEFLVGFAEMLDLIQKLDDEIKEKIIPVMKLVQQRTDALLEVQNSFKDVIQKHIHDSDPFSWNRNIVTDSNKQERVKKDLKYHDYLTIYSMVAEDENLLEEWGVNYPLDQNGSGLADPSFTYVKALIAASSKSASERQKACYEYLIEKLAAKLNLTEELNSHLHPGTK